MRKAFFDVRSSPQGELLIPSRNTASGWGTDYLRGMAVSGALARATEQAVEELHPENLMRPARFTLDLFRPARNLETRVRTEVVRSGRRLMLIDAVLEQHGKDVARSATLFLNPTRTPDGQVWNSVSEPVAPPPELEPDEDDERIYFDERHGWTRSSSSAHVPSRHQSWHFPTPVVSGEALTAFQMAASIADVSNVIANWGDQGLAFINGDVTLTLARLPRALNMGLSATGRVEREGISSGSAVLYDRDGVFGMSLVTGVANPDARVDPRTRQAMVQTVDK